MLHDFLGDKNRRERMLYSLATRYPSLFSENCVSILYSLQMELQLWTKESL